MKRASLCVAVTKSDGVLNNRRIGGDNYRDTTCSNTSRFVHEDHEHMSFTGGGCSVSVGSVPHQTMSFHVMMGLMPKTMSIDLIYKRRYTAGCNRPPVPMFVFDDSESTEEGWLVPLED